MKFVILLLAAVVMAGCQQPDEIFPTHGSIQFTLANADAPGGRASEMLVPVAVLVSIADAQNNPVEQNKKVALYSFGNGFVSESLQLMTGSYKLTQFIVLDANDKVIYATPVEDSDLAQLVNDPLPIDFNVTENGSTLVTPQVLAVTDNNTPESFGYISFGFEIVVVDAPSPKLKTWYTYVFNNECECFIPSSKVFFYYDATGRLSSFDVYGNFNAANGYQHNWHHAIDYVDNPGSTYYVETNWSVATGQIQSIREVHYNEGLKINYTKLFQGPYLLSDCQYEYTGAGFTTLVNIYNNGTYASTWKAEYDLDEAGNMIRKRNYTTQNALLDEATYSYGASLNPLSGFYPLLTGSESRNNVLKMTTSSFGYYEENYVYHFSPEGYVTEKIMTGSNGVKEKSVFEYY